MGDAPGSHSYFSGLCFVTGMAWSRNCYQFNYCLFAHGPRGWHFILDGRAHFSIFFFLVPHQLGRWFEVLFIIHERFPPDPIGLVYEVFSGGRFNRLDTHFLMTRFHSEVDDFI